MTNIHLHVPTDLRSVRSGHRHRRLEGDHRRHRRPRPLRIPPPPGILRQKGARFSPVMATENIQQTLDIGRKGCDYLAPAAICGITQPVPAIFYDSIHKFLAIPS